MHILFFFYLYLKVALCYLSFKNVKTITKKTRVGLLCWHLSPDTQSSPYDTSYVQLSNYLVKPDEGKVTWTRQIVGVICCFFLHSSLSGTCSFFRESGVQSAHSLPACKTETSHSDSLRREPHQILTDKATHSYFHSSHSDDTNCVTSSTSMLVGSCVGLFSALRHVDSWDLCWPSSDWLITASCRQWAQCLAVSQTQ